MPKRPNTRKPQGAFDAALLVLNVALVAGVALILWGFDCGLRKEAEIAALKDNKFLTTEWRLMRELKAKTDQALQDKDREIDSLRQQYLRLKETGSSADRLAEIEAAMAKAESERKAILASRQDPDASPRPATQVVYPAPPAQSAGGGSPAAEPAPAAAVLADAVSDQSPDNALAMILRRRILSLEEALGKSQAGSAEIERELEALRLEAAARRAEDGSSVAAAAIEPPAPSAPFPEPAPSASENAVAAILAALESEKAGLEDPETVLSLSDLKTRSIMRAIVRSAAIRSQYPDLFESLDRYLELVEKEGYLKGKQEALDEIIDTMKSLGKIGS